MKMNRMTKVAGLLAIILLAPAIMASCKKEEPVINVTSVGLNNSELTLNAGESETLKAFVSPTAATNKDVTWTSSDPSVATVDNGGKVTALKIGFTNIKATTVDGGKTAVSDLVVTTGGKRVTVEAGENMLKAGSQGIARFKTNMVNIYNWKEFEVHFYSGPEGITPKQMSGLTLGVGSTGGNSISWSLIALSAAPSAGTYYFRFRIDSAWSHVVSFTIK